MTPRRHWNNKTHRGGRNSSNRNSNNQNNNHFNQDGAEQGTPTNTPMTQGTFTPSFPLHAQWQPYGGARMQQWPMQPQQMPMQQGLAQIPQMQMPPMQTPHWPTPRLPMQMAQWPYQTAQLPTQTPQLLRTNIGASVAPGPQSRPESNLQRQAGGGASTPRPKREASEPLEDDEQARKKQRRRQDNENFWKKRVVVNRPMSLRDFDDETLKNLCRRCCGISLPEGWRDCTNKCIHCGRDSHMGEPCSQNRAFFHLPQLKLARGMEHYPAYSGVPRNKSYLELVSQHGQDKDKLGNEIRRREQLEPRWIRHVEEERQQRIFGGNEDCLDDVQSEVTSHPNPRAKPRTQRGSTNTANTTSTPLPTQREDESDEAYIARGLAYFTARAQQRERHHALNAEIPANCPRLSNAINSEDEERPTLGNQVSATQNMAQGQSFSLNDGQEHLAPLAEETNQEHAGVQQLEITYDVQHYVSWLLRRVFNRYPNLIVYFVEGSNWADLRSHDNLFEILSGNQLRIAGGEILDANAFLQVAMPFYWNEYLPRGGGDEWFPEEFLIDLHNRVIEALAEG